VEGTTVGRSVGRLVGVHVSYVGASVAAPDDMPGVWAPAPAASASTAMRRTVIVTRLQSAGSGFWYRLLFCCASQLRSG